MPRNASRVQKHQDVLGLVRDSVRRGRYLDTRHGLARMKERQVTLPELLYVLLHGRHEKRKDEFKADFNAWNYAIRGRTVDGRELRVCVSFDVEIQMLIITAIDLDA